MLVSDLPFKAAGGQAQSAGRSLADAENQHILKILRECEWNISRAARLLQIDRVTLYNKIKRYDLRRD